MVQFNVEADMRPVQELLGQVSPDELNRRSHAAMLEATNYLRNKVVEETPVDQGIGRGSVVAEVNGTGVNITGRVVTIQTHMIVLEEGRRPGQKPPPVAAIAGWVHRKHLAGVYSVKTRRRLKGKATQDKQDLAAAFVIARSIGKKGTKPHHMFSEAARKGKGHVDAIFRRHFRI